MLHEKYLPVFHFSEKHRIFISASSKKIYRLASDFNASGSWIIKLLLALRGIPAKTSTGMEGWKKMGFILLEQQRGQEIILGLIGQFWKPSGNIQFFTPEEFASFNSSGFVKATWNFVVHPAEQGKVLLETETRILCGSDEVRRKFGMYWFFIRPFSGLIRMEMLKMIKNKAEQGP